MTTQNITRIECMCGRPCTLAYDRTAKTFIGLCERCKTFTPLPQIEREKKVQ